MRGLLLAALLLASPAQAWEFSQGRLCEIRDQTAASDTRLFYDPRRGIYGLVIHNLSGTFPVAQIFAIQFVGPRGLTISTARQFAPGGDQAKIAVMDRGFGNVLNGLQYNHTARILMDGQEVLTLDTSDAAPAIEAFRRCSETPVS